MDNFTWITSGAQKGGYICFSGLICVFIIRGWLQRVETLVLVTAEPRWRKNTCGLIRIFFFIQEGHPLPESPRWKFIKEDNNYTLVIYEVQPLDAGVYACVAINTVGKATCTARLTVESEFLELSQSCWKNFGFSLKLILYTYKEIAINSIISAFKKNLLLNPNELLLHLSVLFH